ncbi:sugar kinase [Spirulina sp. CS-785/01]|uniref:sugar kinase n=1 Tax=Spirulina sp. CS-785/01 TaxID=3021716 RepID=UPI00232BF618|nr:sugar kinase [Spirulina sp. CS-785/01]MDB9314449.1 sugar kinase [Spirulina sp. CS-785/01]
MQHLGLFVGLTTLDLIYQVAQFPQANEKIVALDYKSSAGGPATNAAVTFAALGNRAKLVSIVGQHPNSALVGAELEEYGVELCDLDEGFQESPPLSSIIVTQETGDRAVISLNAKKSQATVPQLPPNILDHVALVLIDGHQMAVSEAIAQDAQTRGIPVIIDGGSWKPNFERVLPYVDYAICSANFYPPNCQTPDQVLPVLQQFQIPHIAITRGSDPIVYVTQGQKGELTVPTVPVTDTLGAGDIFHGAFCHALLQQDFLTALQQAATVAAHACQSFGTRDWIQTWTNSS